MTASARTSFAEQSGENLPGRAGPFLPSREASEYRLPDRSHVFCVPAPVSRRSTARAPRENTIRTNTAARAARCDRTNLHTHADLAFETGSIGVNQRRHECKTSGGFIQEERNAEASAFGIGRMHEIVARYADRSLPREFARRAQERGFVDGAAPPCVFVHTLENVDERDRPPVSARRRASSASAARNPPSYRRLTISLSRMSLFAASPIDTVRGVGILAVPLVDRPAAIPYCPSVITFARREHLVRVVSS